MHPVRREIIFGLAVFLGLSAVFFPLFMTGILGLGLIFLSALSWRSWGGLSAFVYASFLLMFPLFSSPDLRWLGFFLAVLALIGLGMMLGRFFWEGKGEIQDVDRDEKNQGTFTSWNLLNAVPVPLLVVDTQLLILFANQQLVKEYPATLENNASVIGRPLREVFPSLPESVYQEYQQVFATGESIITEGTTQRGDCLYDTETTKSPVKNEKGEVVSVMTQIRDITGEKKAWEQIKKSQRNYWEIFNSVNDAIFIQDIVTGDIIDLNEPALQMYGCCEKEKMTGPGKWDQFNHVRAGYHQERAQETIKKALASDNPTFEWAARDKKGNPFWVEASVKKAIIDGEERLLEVVRDISHRKQVEKALVESQERLRSIFNNLTDVVWSLSWPDMRLYYISPSVEKIYGRSVREFEENPSLWEEMTHPQDRHLRDEALAQLLEEGTVLREVRFIRPDGEMVWVQDKSMLVYDEQKKPIRIEGISSDITQRKKMEEKLTASEDRFQKMLALIPDMISIHDQDMNIVYSNWNGFGAVPEEKRILQTKCYQTYRGSDEICPDCQARMVFKTKKAFQKEMLLPDGRWVDLRVFPILNQENQVELFVEWVRDISDWKESEASLQAAEETYRNLFLNSKVGLFRTDINSGLLLDANDVVAHFAGYENREELLAKPFSIADRYVNAEDRQRMISLVKTQGEFRNFEAPFRRNDGSTILLSFSGKLVPEKGWIEGVSEDITHRKKAEEKLARYTQEVEDLYLQLEEQIYKAQQVHERMLPKSLPQVKGLSIAGYYQPAERIGGDFYDVFQVGNKLVFFLSDVSGHGLDSSMLTLFVKHTIKGFLSFSPLERITPANILHYLAQQFKEENYSEEYFICIFLGLLDLETLELKYSGAGFQDTPLVRMGDGRQDKLVSKGFFISSVFSHSVHDFKEERIALAPGSTLFFTTDGLTEQGVQGVYYMDRLPFVFYQHGHLPVQLIRQALVEDFQKFNQGSLQGDDDITFLVMKIEPEVKKRLPIQLKSSFSDLERLGDMVVHFFQPQDVSFLFTCLHELVVNAMEHGNGMDPEKNVLVEILVMPEYIQVQVEDEGEGFDWQKRIQQPLDLEGNRERGRGIAMTRILSQGLYYNALGNQATVILSNPDS